MPHDPSLSVVLCQLAEAVVYLQPLVSFREAMRANESGAVAAMDQTANQAWGMSQSLAPSQVSVRENILD